MKKLVFRCILIVFLFCGSAEAINKGDVRYIKKGAWWTITLRTLEVVNDAIKAKDYIYLLHLSTKKYLFIQKVKLKVAVIKKTGNRVKVRVFGTGYTLWIIESFLIETR